MKEKEDMKETEEEMPGKPEETPEPPKDEKTGTPATPKPPEPPKDPEEQPLKPEERVYPRVSRKQEKAYHLAHRAWDNQVTKQNGMRNKYEQFVNSIADEHELVARGPYCIFEKHIMTVADMQRVRRGILKLDEVEKKDELLKPEVTQDDRYQNEMNRQQLVVNEKFIDLANLKNEIAEKNNYSGPTLWDLTEFGEICPRPIGKIMKAQYVQMELDARAAEEQAEKDEEENAARQ
jgi:type IV secretory pathway VirB10-like protein